MTRIAFVLTALLVAGCATKPQTTAGLEQDMPLQPAANDQFGSTLVYRAPDFDVRKYRGLFIAPPDLYDGADADWGGTDMALRQRVANALATETRRVLKARGKRVVPAAGPGIITLQLTLAGIRPTYGIAANAIKLTPVGLGMTLAKSAAGLPASFTGSITVGGRLTDSQSGTLLAGFISRVSPTALDPRTLGGTESTAMLAATKAAGDFADAVDRAQKQPK